MVCIMGAALTDWVDRQPLELSDRRSATFWSGIMCGCACTIAWISSVLANRGARFAISMAGLVAATLAIAAINQRSPLRYATLFGGVVVVQSAMFAALGVPPWRSRFGPNRAGRNGPTDDVPTVDPTSIRARPASTGGGPAGRDAGRRPFQFAVLDVLAATTALGLLLGLARQYSPPLGGDLYWVVTGLIWLWLSCLSAGTVAVVLARDVMTAASVLVFTVAVAIAGLLGLGLAEQRQRELDRAQIDELIFDYAAFPLGYIGVLAAGTLAGRYDRSVLESPVPDEST